MSLGTTAKGHRHLDNKRAGIAFADGFIRDTVYAEQHFLDDSTEALLTGAAASGQTAFMQQDRLQLEYPESR